MSDPRTTLRPPSRAPWIVLLAAVAALVALVVVWRRSREAPPSAPAAPAAEAVPAAAPPAPVPVPDPARVRSLLEGLSASPAWRRCLAEEDPLRRAAVLADNLAEGVSPRKALACLAPPGGFAVERHGGRTVVAAASWRRYDEVAGTVAALDVRAVAGAYRDLAPALQAAYRALGYPGASLDAVVGKALRRLAAVPVPPDGAEVEVVEAKGALWAYADPGLEALGPAEKHLLRMGPANARRVQQWARALEAALGLPGGAAR